MKLLIIFSIISSLALSINTQFVDLCIWQQQRDQMIKSFTPTGQAIVGQLLKDLQVILGAAVQPLYNQIKKENQALVTQLETTDGAQFTAFYNMLGYGNLNCGTCLWAICVSPLNFHLSLIFKKKLSNFFFHRSSLHHWHTIVLQIQATKSASCCYIVTSGS